MTPEIMIRKTCRCWLQYLFVLVLFVPALPINARQVERNEAAPGYFEQWVDMKRDERGMIPRGLYTAWNEHDKRHALGMQSLSFPAPPSSSVQYLSPVDVGGRTRALLIDSSNQNRLFAGAISGGLWRSDDRGATWLPINDAAVSMMVSSITQSPFDAKILYYGTGETRANSAGIPGEGVFKSTDNGLSFSQLTSTSTDSRFRLCWCVEHSRSSANVVYVGTENGGLMRTLDGGLTWDQVLAAGPVTDAIAMADGSVIAAVSGRGVFRSTSGDPATFAKVNSSAFPAGFRRIEIVHCETNSRILYAAFEDPSYLGGVNAFCTSTDQGLTWTSRTTPRTGAIYDRYCFVLGVNPQNPDKLVCGGVNLKFSMDGGHTWYSASRAHADHHSFANFTDNADQFLIGNDGGVFRYSWSSPTSQPDDLNTGYHVAQFYAGDFAPVGDLAIGGTQDNGTWKILAGNQKSMFGGDGAHCHVSLQNPDTAYCSWQHGHMLRTLNFSNSAPTWHSINTHSGMDSEGYLFINPFQINYSEGKQLYCRTNQAMWRTLDSGQTWTRLTNGSISGLYAIGCSDAPDPILYLGGSSALLYRIDNASSSSAGSEVDLGNSVPTPVTNDFLGSITVHPTDPGIIYVGFTNFRMAPRIWKVINADTNTPTWSDISGDLPKRLPVNYIQVDPGDPEHLLYAATDFGLYYTSDGGSTWVKETRVPNVSIHELKLRANDRSLFLFTHGRGVWKVKLN